MSAHDIIDNQTESLADHIRSLFANTERAKFAVGYFFLSGFQAIADRLEDVEELRLLIGNTTTKETIDQLVEGHKRLELVEELLEKQRFITPIQQKDAAEKAAEDLREVLALSDQTDENQRLIPTLARLIQEKKIKVRVYTKGRLHAKAYIFDYKKGHDQRGVAIVGSSNLTLAGVQSNTELNVKVYGDSNHQALTEWFEQLWADSRDFDELLLKELQQSWAMNLVSPYDIYIKTLYHLARPETEKPEDIFLREFPELAEFQVDAVRHALRILNRHDGVFIADVVGMGKSFVGSALLKHLRQTKRMKPLIICPKSLEDMWEHYNESFDLGARVLPMSMIYEEGINPAEHELYKERRLVLIDESHNFRYSDTQRYKILQPFLHLPDTKVILMTATPRNKSARDLYNQMKLFHPEDVTEIPVLPNSLTRYFKMVEDDERDLRDLLQWILIRRTRRHILEFYGKEDGAGKKYVEIGGKAQYFPKRELKTVEYSIEKTYAGLYTQLRSYIGRPSPEPSDDELWYARYGLWNYVKPEKRTVEPYARLHRAGRNLRGLMRVILFKRLESSVEAFRLTLGRMLQTHTRFKEALERGIVPAGDKAEDLLYETRAEEEERIYEQLQDLDIEYNINDFEADGLKHAIEHDIAILKEMIKLVEPITPGRDEKLQELQRLLIRGHLRARKLLIFSQFAETARYLHTQVNPNGDPKIDVIDSTEKNKSRVVKKFAPKANRYELTESEHPINLLIATDVLSEGLNLQDCDTIINYDLHWNPVRLIQRIGRIDRIGTENDRVYAYNFLPELDLERQLGLREKLTRRIQEIHDTIGEDAAILDKSERVNEEAMYAIYHGDEKELEKHEAEEEIFSYLDAEEIIRRLEKEQPDYIRRIKGMPDGVRSARSSSFGAGMVVFCRAGDYQQLFWTDDEGNVLSRDVGEGIRRLKCDPSEPTKGLPKNYNAVVSKVRRSFEAEVRESATAGITARRTDAQNYVLRELEILYKDTDDEDERAQLSILERIFRSTGLTQAVRKELIRVNREKLQGSELIERLVRIVYDHNLWHILDRETVEVEMPVARIVCSEALAE